uniref:Pfr-TSERA1 protein n=1 Tax=Plasmodium fragile TaxID=5857 RepID=F1SZ21_PLAFR|nr:Pfr-TSERA1 [Plasmodium fragile]
MKSLVTLLFIPSAVWRHNAQGFVNAESTPGSIIWGKASNGYILTQGASEQKRLITTDDRSDNCPGKCQTGHGPAPAIHRASSKNRKPSEGTGQANYSKVNAQVLKKTIGVNINRMWGAEMEFLFTPQSYIHVTMEDSKAGAFNMLTYLEHNALPLTWNVYLPVEPLTATKSDASGTKWYRRTLSENNDGPDDAGYDFFSGENDSEKDADIPSMGNDNQVEGCSGEALEEFQLWRTIDRVLKWVYKVTPGGRKVLITQEELNNSMKRDLKIYCQVLKKVDRSGTLEEHPMGSEMDVFHNLVKLLQKHGGESVFTLRRKMRNPAVCMQNANQWVLKRRGLVLPDSSSSNASAYDTNLGVGSEWMQFVNSNSRDASIDRDNGEQN